MKANACRSVPRLGAAGAVLLLLLSLSTPPARAVEPELAVRLVGGQSEIYPVSTITRVAFSGDELAIITGGGTDFYPLVSIIKIDFDWGSSSADDLRGAADLVAAMHLFQNRPNPFSAQTEIAFQLSSPGRVALRIWAPDGSLVRNLIDEERPAGLNNISWDGLDNSGRKLSGGVYFYSLSGPGLDEGRQMILLP